MDTAINVLQERMKATLKAEQEQLEPIGQPAEKK
jgi:hypothetical protein